MDEIDILAIGITLLVFACVSDVARAGRFTAPMMFAGMGLLLGPLLLDLVQLDVGSGAVQKISEMTLVTALFTDAVRIDAKHVLKFHSMPMRLLGIGLPLTMVAGTLVAWWLFPAFGFWEAAVLAVILTPTDAALGEPVMTSEKVPALVRQGLNVESGLNDGLGLPCLVIAAYLATSGVSGPTGAGEWAAYILLQIVGGPVIGLLIALVTAKAIARPIRLGWVGDDFFRLGLLALPIVAFLAADLVQANGFLAAFVAGIVVSTRSEATRNAVQDFGGTVGQFLSATVFFIVGAALLPAFLHHIGWPHVIFAVLALTVLRMVPVALALTGLRLHRRTLMFVGWFGPRGMASVIYLMIVIERYNVVGIDDIAATVALTVLISIILHGLTAASGSRRYGEFAHALHADDAERKPVPAQHGRIKTKRCDNI